MRPMAIPEAKASEGTKTNSLKCHDMSGTCGSWVIVLLESRPEIYTLNIFKWPETVNYSIISSSFGMSFHGIPSS